jgi:hypothetical protein
MARGRRSWVCHGLRRGDALSTLNLCNQRINSTRSLKVRQESSFMSEGMEGWMNILIYGMVFM